MLSSDVQKLVDFAQCTNGLNAEQIVKAALDQRVALMGVITDQDYRVFAHCAEAGEREWHLFILFLSKVWGWYPDGAAAHVEYLSRKRFMDPDEWLGEEGDRFRRPFGGSVSEEFKRSWAEFKEQNHDRPQTRSLRIRKRSLKSAVLCRCRRRRRNRSGAAEGWQHDARDRRGHHRRARRVPARVHAAARPAAFRVIVDRLRERYGTKLVDKALLQYEREMRAENRRLKQDNRRLERQARAEWMKRQ